MASDIYTLFDHPDNLVSFTPSFNQPLYDEEDNDFLRLITASSPDSSLPLPQLLSLKDPPPPRQFQEPLVFPSYSAEEGSMQRSYSTNRMDSGTGSPEDSHLFGGEDGQGIIKRVYSTDDLQARTKSYTVREGVVVVVRAAERYGTEERKERIEKYRAKRNLRNFNKTIKYACRKTLADSRPRIRGRFARNDDVPYAATPPPPPPPTLRHRGHVDSSSPLWKEDR